MKKILFASIGLFAVAMITQLLSAGGQADVRAATGPASNPASQKLVTVDISNPGNVIALRDEIIKHYMVVVSQIPDDAQFITIEQAYAIEILGLYRASEAVPMLFKHLTLRVDTSNNPPGIRLPPPPRFTEAMEALKKISAGGGRVFEEAVKSIQNSPDVLLQNPNGAVYEFYFFVFSRIRVGNVRRVLMENLIDSNEGKAKEAFSLFLPPSSATQPTQPAEDQSKSTAEVAVRRLDTVKNTTSQPAAVYVNQLRMLAEQIDVAAGPERPYGFEYYSKCLEKVRAAKDKSAIPWLGGILKLDDISGDTLKGYPYSTISQMYEDFSRLWYELQWDDLTTDDKLKIALYGFVPGSPVAPHPKVSMEYLVKIGKDTRSRIYDILMDKNFKFDMSTPYKVWRMGCWKDLLSQEIFKPTDDEVKNVYANGGEYGKIVILKYATENAKPYAIDWINDVFKESANEPIKVSYVLGLRDFISNISADNKKRLFDVIFGLGSDIAKRFQMGDFKLNDPDLFYQVCIYLELFDKNENAIKLLRSFIEAKKKNDLNIVWKFFSEKKQVELFPAYVRNLDDAIERANLSLDKWSGKDEDE